MRSTRSTLGGSIASSRIGFPVVRPSPQSRRRLRQLRDLEAIQSGNRRRQRGIGVGNGCFSEAVSNANLGAKAFRRSFSEEQSAIGRDSYLNLSRQGGDIQRLQIGWPAWEPTVIAEEHQPRCKGESVLSALGHHHGVIAGGQRLQRKFTKALVAHGAITSVYATLATTRESLPLDA